MTQMIASNRMELLKTKEKKKIAVKGHSILKKKRDALIKKFFELIKDYKELKIKTIEKLELAYKVLQKAEGVSGVNRVKGLSLSSEESIDLKIEKSNLMGVKIPKFDITNVQASINASLIGVSFYTKDTRDKFLEILPLTLKLAEIEHTIFKIAEEIKKTKRKVNSLEYIKIPEIKDLENKIKQNLSEQERESFVRLKNVKKRMDSKQ